MTSRAGFLFARPFVALAPLTLLAACGEAARLSRPGSAEAPLVRAAAAGDAAAVRRLIAAGVDVDERTAERPHRRHRRRAGRPRRSRARL